MIPLRDPAAETGHADRFEEIPDELDLERVARRRPRQAGGSTASASASRARTSPTSSSGRRSRSRAATRSRAAPELARLTLNVAKAHTDAGASAHGRRLVYGGHTIAIAAAQATRAIPEPGHDRRLARLRPPRAGVRGRRPRDRAQRRGRRSRSTGGGGLVDLRARVQADRSGSGEIADGARLELRGIDGLGAERGSRRWESWTGMRVVEGSAFVAAPLGGMTLAQLGADVIRFDPIGGGLDRNRWPVTEDGKSLFWAGLNKGKRSIQVDLRSPAGQELVDRPDHRSR